MNKPEQKYTNKINKTTKEIIKINNQNTKLKIDLITKCRYNYKKWLWQEKITNDIKLYITYLGLIDNFIINENITQNTYYLEQRYRLVNLIKENTNIIYIFDNINEIFNRIPICIKSLYNSLSRNEHILDLQLRFINTYNKGLNEQNYIPIDYIINEFEKNLKKININENKNNKKLKKIHHKHEKRKRKALNIK